ncbi:DUF2256 domain-containing protein [Yoonia ponticola]|uniref:DUF2256 domain-containing protein n=1 Tax=Yoonia ponticola TaxID=1524255 RepID=UPI003CCE0CA2
MRSEWIPTGFSSRSQPMKKCNLPQKICPICMRSFSWRKKWEKNWEDVRYCSVRCRNARNSTSARS